MTANYFSVRREVRRRAGLCRNCRCARLPEGVFCAQHRAKNREEAAKQRARAAA